MDNVIQLESRRKRPLTPLEQVQQLYSKNKNNPEGTRFLDDEFRDGAEPVYLENIDVEEIQRISKELLEKAVDQNELKELYRSEKSDYFQQHVIILNPDAYETDADDKTEDEFAWVAVVTDGNGKPIVRTKRIVRKHAENDVRLVKDHLYIVDDYQGQGIGTLLHEREEEWCRENEIDFCEIETESVGGYVWAMMGYDFKRDEDRTRLAQKIKRYCRKHRLVLEEDLLDPDIDKQDQEELLESEQEEWMHLRTTASSWELASLVAYDKEGNAIRVGKEQMLGEHWKGERDLRTSSSSTRQHRKYMQYLEEKHQPEVTEAESVAL